MKLIQWQTRIEVALALSLLLGACGLQRHDNTSVDEEADLMQQEEREDAAVLEDLVAAGVIEEDKDFDSTDPFLDVEANELAEIAATEVDPNDPELKSLLAEMETQSLALGATSLGWKIVLAGRKYLGRPYKFGASIRTTSKFDCSSFTYRAVRNGKGGVMQRTARAQQAQLARSKRAVRVSFSTKKMRAGDLLYWKLGRKGLAKSKPSHTGIYIGRGMFIHASGSKGVTISKLKGLWTRKGKVHSAYRIKSKLN